MGFGHRIKEARISRDIGPSEFARKIGVSKTTLWSWENGTATTINGDNLIAVSRALYVSPEYIMTGKKPSGELTPEEEEVIALFHKLTDLERSHIIGILRAITDSRLAPKPPKFDYTKD